MWRIRYCKTDHNSSGELLTGYQSMFPAVELFHLLACAPWNGANWSKLYWPTLVWFRGLSSAAKGRIAYTMIRRKQEGDKSWVRDGLILAPPLVAVGGCAIRYCQQNVMDVCSVKDLRQYWHAFSARQTPDSILSNWCWWCSHRSCSCVFLMYLDLETRSSDKLS